MKKQLFTTLLALLLSARLLAQYDTVYVNGVPKLKKQYTPNLLPTSPVVKDDYLFELSYGYPFSPRSDADFNNSNVFNNVRNLRETSNTNHLCAGVNYVLNEDYSIGLGFTYATMEFKYTRQYFTQVNTGTGYVTKSSDTTFTTRVTKVRFLTTLSQHFNISEKFDAFATVGFGFKNMSFATRDNLFYNSNVGRNALPIAIRASVGGRFFFDKNIAIHVQAGIGGPIMQMGLTYKMH